MTPLPTVVGLFMCEKTIVEEGTRNITLVSAFTKLVVDRFPSPPQQFALVVALTDGLGDARIRLIGTRLETGEDTYGVEQRIHFPDRLHEMRVIFKVAGCSFPAPGSYQFTLYLDNEWLAQRRFLVVQREAPP
jgi:hypothetical protein